MKTIQLGCKRLIAAAVVATALAAKADTVVWYTFDDLGDTGTKVHGLSTVQNDANSGTYDATVYQMAGKTKNTTFSGALDWLYVTNGIPEAFRVFDPVARATASSVDSAVRFASPGGGQAGAMLEAATDSSFFTDSFTVEAFVRFPEGMDSAAYGVLATQLRDGNSLAWKLRFSWNRELEVTFRNSSGEDVALGKASLPTGINFNDGRWHHVAMTVAQGVSTSTVKIYFDYSRRTTFTPAYRVQFPESAENSVLQIGGTTLAKELFMGEIGEFRYSSAALEGAQFLHPRDKEASDSQCVLYYDFETSRDWSWLAASVGAVANMAHPGIMDGAFATKAFDTIGTLPKVDSEAAPASRVRESMEKLDWADNTSSLYNNYESARNSSNYLYSDLDSSVSLAEADFTIEAFYKTDGEVQYWTPLFRDNGSGEPVFLGMGDNVANIGNSCFCGKVVQSDGTAKTVTDTARTNDGKWHHIALVREGRTLKLYRDKVLRASAALDCDSLNASGDRWQICGSPARYTYNGWLDSLRVTLKALEPEEFLTSQCYPEGGTIAHLKFDDGTASAAAGGGALFNGVMNSATFSDKVPGCKILDGEGGMVLSNPNVASLSIPNTSATVTYSNWDDLYYLRKDANGVERTSGTIELWVKGTVKKTYDAILDAKMTANGAYSDNLHIWRLGYDESDGGKPSVLFRYLKTDGTRDNQCLTFDKEVTDGKWHHWAFTFQPNASDSTKSDIAFYLDHVQIGNTQTLNGRVAYDDTLRFAIGEGGSSFIGLIDELRISDCVLDPSEFLRAEDKPGFIMTVW